MLCKTGRGGYRDDFAGRAFVVPMQSVDGTTKNTLSSLLCQGLVTCQGNKPAYISCVMRDFGVQGGKIKCIGNLLILSVSSIIWITE